MVNGAFSLLAPLQARATNAEHPSTVFAPITPSASPLTLLTWAHPVGNEAVSIGLKQPISASEPLRTGAYSKTLTFTLSTTAP
jgi:hypothetical protein